MEQVDILDMPAEVLTHIFEKLPLSDRKSVRLTCSFWNQCATSASISKREKYQFDGSNGCQYWHIERSMLKPSFFIQNFVFVAMNLSVIRGDVWKECGPRIRSLTFRNCLWHPRTLEFIMTQCVELKRLAFDFAHVDLQHLFDVSRIHLSSTSIPMFLDKFIEKNKFVRARLETLEVGTSDEELTWEIIERFFEIYRTISLVKITTDCGKISREKLQNIHQHYQHLEEVVVTDGHSSATYRSTPREQMSLERACLNNRDTSQRWIEQLNFGEGSLKQLEWTVKYSASSIIKDFFSSQPNLRVVKLSLLHCTREVHSEIISFVIRTCPSLVDFQFRFIRPGQVRRGLLWSESDMSSICMVPV